MKKKTAKAGAKSRALAKRLTKPTDLLGLAGAKKGLPVVTSGLYFQPVVPMEMVLWNVKRNTDGSVQSSKPYAPYPLLVDNTHRRGVLAVETEELPPMKCKDRGCYNAAETDIQHRFKAIITLENGQKFTGHGEACRHNTTRITRTACPRMAETRAKARAMRDATNIGIACVVEIDNFQGAWRQGQSELKASDVEGQVVRDVKQPDQTGASTQGGKRAALPAPSEGTPTPEGDKAKAMKELHAVANEQKVNIVGLHAWIHKKANVASLTDLNALKLKQWADELRRLEGDELVAFQQNCLAVASGGETKS
jgi:hypothetical protein